MSLIPFPNVPALPGVPALARSLTVPSVSALSNYALAGLTELAGFKPPEWGIFDQTGHKILEPDAFVDFDYRNSSRISSYPQEKGAFASYNKVSTPYDVRVRMAIGGDKASRGEFLVKVGAMLNSIELYTVMTPDATYYNASLSNYDYRRESRNGATMLTVDMLFVEVRITGKVEFSNVKSFGSASPISNGQVQAFPVSNETTIIETEFQ